jgi:N6-adenosine-specific RNA methylase IME4
LGKKKLVFPFGKYAVILADPPWRYENDGYPFSTGSKYPTLTVEEICAMAESIGGAATEETILFLWATPPLLLEALQVMAAWGFKYRTHLVWDKVRPMAMGWFVWPRHEVLLIGVRSKAPHPKDRSESVFFASRRRHSEKPEEAYTIIERMYAGPYLELFARAKRKGWAVYGNEIEENETATVAALR